MYHLWLWMDLCQFCFTNSFCSFHSDKKKEYLKNLHKQKSYEHSKSASNIARSCWCMWERVKLNSSCHPFSQSSYWLNGLSLTCISIQFSCSSKDSLLIEEPFLVAIQRGPLIDYETHIRASIQIVKFFQQSFYMILHWREDFSFTWSLHRRETFCFIRSRTGKKPVEFVFLSVRIHCYLNSLCKLTKNMR